MVRIKRALHALMARFCDTLYADDPDTLAHSRRVARYAELIAKDMGLPPSARQRIYRAALLHDIGKLAVPKSILRKPAKLTVAETRKIAEHPRISRTILSRYRPFADILAAVLHHHERFDGKGYPEGLAGSAIPMESRIIAVADTFDAMTSGRPYRERVPFPLAAREMALLADRQFDARILNHLHRLLPRLEAR